MCVYVYMFIYELMAVQSIFDKILSQIDNTLLPKSFFEENLKVKLNIFESSFKIRLAITVHFYYKSMI